MNCCNDYGQCQQGHNCAAHQVAVVPVCTSQNCDAMGVCQCTTALVMAARDIAPDYMTPWEWIADIGRSAMAAAVAAGIVGVGMGFIYGRWVL